MEPRPARWLARLLRRRASAGPGGAGGDGRRRRGDDGGAGVREPRRPRPNPPGIGAHAVVEPQQRVDVGSAPPER